MKKKFVKISISGMLFIFPIILFCQFQEGIEVVYIGGVYCTVWGILLVISAYFMLKNRKKYNSFWFLLLAISFILWLFLLFCVDFSLELLTGGFRVSD